MGVEFSGKNKLLFVIPILLLSSILILSSANPHIRYLFQEGYPSSEWPSKGKFAKVLGQDNRQLPSKQIKQFKSKWLDDLFDDSYGKGFAIYKTGLPVLEYYADGYSAETKFNSFSAVKSLIGLLVFIALDEGKLSSLDIPIGSILKDLNHEDLKTVPIRSFLNMTSGIEFEPNGLKSVSGAKDPELTITNPFGPMAQLHFQGYGTIKAQLKSSKKEVFNYQNVNTALLGQVLEKIYNLPLNQLLSIKLWKPAGAATAYWRHYSLEDHISAYCCLYARVKDWVFVARYIMNNGKENSRLLSTALWKEFLGYQVDENMLLKGHYENHARYNILDRVTEPLQGRFTFFLGQGGQIIYILPAKYMVVVRFGKKTQLLHSTLYASWRELLLRYAEKIS